MATLHDLLRGDIISEPHTERQRCIPLEQMKMVEMDKYLFEYEYMNKH